jgi:acetylornithine deacetylase/succinyl-diaminopimelate desuccinylase-like protein
LTDTVVDNLEKEHDAVLERLKAVLRLPSVSTNPAYAEGMAATRQFFLDRLQAIGLENVQLLDGGGHPAVYGSWTSAAGAPTLIIYGHYDVQPPEPLDLWETPPFEPTIRNGRLYARGASDVKGSTTIAVETIGAFLAVMGRCPVNVKFFIEGEEEIGSPSLRTIVERHRRLLEADGMISADGGRAGTKIPTLNTGARGIPRGERAHCRQGHALRPLRRRTSQCQPRAGGPHRLPARLGGTHHGSRVHGDRSGADRAAEGRRGSAGSRRGGLLCRARRRAARRP